MSGGLPGHGRNPSVPAWRGLRVTLTQWLWPGSPGFTGKQLPGRGSARVRPQSMATALASFSMAWQDSARRSSIRRLRACVAMLRRFPRKAMAATPGGCAAARLLGQATLRPAVFGASRDWKARSPGVGGEIGFPRCTMTVQTAFRYGVYPYFLGAYAFSLPVGLHPMAISG